MFDVHAFVDLHHSLFLVNRHKCDRKASEPLSHFILFYFIFGRAYPRNVMAKYMDIRP